MDSKSCRIVVLDSGSAGACAQVHVASLPAAWNVQEFESFLGAEETMAHGALDAASGRLVGFVLSRIAADEAEILTLAVAPGERRRGVARRLLRDHIGCLAAAAVTSLFLEVDTGNLAARALYTNLGFVQVGTRKAYYRSGRATVASALVLRLDLGRNRPGEARGQRAAP